MTELSRRLHRVEVLLDERIATVDMLRASERLYEARELSHAATTQALESRVGRLEASGASLQRMFIGACLVLLVNIILLVLTISSRGAP